MISELKISDLQISKLTFSEFVTKNFPYRGIARVAGSVLVGLSLLPPLRPLQRLGRLLQQMHRTRRLPPQLSLRPPEPRSAPSTSSRPSLPQMKAVAISSSSAKNSSRSRMS